MDRDDPPILSLISAVAALQIRRPAFERFFESLGEDQRKTLDALASTHHHN